MDAWLLELPDKNEAIYEFSTFRLDVSERILWHNGERVQIPDKPFAVLCVLAARSGSLVSKDEMISSVWGDTIVEENNLDKSISALRNILGQRKGQEKFIETVRGHGYRFVVETTRVTSEPSTGSDKNLADRGRLSRPTTRSAFRPARNSSNVVELAEWQSADPKEAGQNAAHRLNHFEDRPSHRVEPQREHSSANAGRNKVLVFLVGSSLAAAALFTFYFGFVATPKTLSSVAVLPFVNLTQDPNGDYLSDGISESIINNLSLRPDLKVMSRNSAFRFRENQSDIRNIASQLGVDGIVTGDINQVGDKFVINVRLINTADESQVWGHQYVKPSADILAVQNDIARDISRNLGARFSQPPETKYTQNPEAYRAYLKGRYLAENHSKSDTRNAIKYFQEAIVLDPSFAAAYAHLAAAYIGVSGSKDFERRETIVKARENVLTALSLDDHLSTAHEVYGFILSSFDNNFVAAEREFKRAIELDPNDASARETYSGLLVILGRFTESLKEAQQAAELNPLSPTIAASVGNSLFFARRYAEAIAQYNKALELDANFIPTHHGLAVTYQMIGNYAESVNERAKMAEIGGDFQGAVRMRESFARGGWQGFLTEMTRGEGAPRQPTLLTATLHIELGENEKALNLLNQLYGEGSPSLVRLNSDPRFDALRGDHRFTDLVKRMNF